MRKRGWSRLAAALAVGAGLAAGSLALGAADAGAAGNPGHYGPGSVYQVEISANTSPTTIATAGQGNFWAWAALHPATTGATTHGTTDYQETDCVHLSALGIPLQAAAHDTGEGSWYIATGELNLTTVKIIGGLELATLSVPLPTVGSYGHTHGMTLTVTTGSTPIPGGFPIPYPSQNQIAP